MPAYESLPSCLREAKKLEPITEPYILNVELEMKRGFASRRFGKRRGPVKRTKTVK